MSQSVKPLTNFVTLDDKLEEKQQTHDGNGFPPVPEELCHVVDYLQNKKHLTCAIQTTI